MNKQNLSIIVLGASGDLAQTKIYPALFSLYCQGLLPSITRFFGFARSNFDLAEFFERGGALTLGLLGIGTDGHTASLFNEADLRESENCYAIPVEKHPPPHRISATKRLISKADRVVFLCTGARKRPIIEQLQHDPQTVIASKAVEDVNRVEVWYSPEENG